MRVTGRRGRARLRLEPVEAQLLLGLFDELDTLLAEPAPGSAASFGAPGSAPTAGSDAEVLARLFPAAYPDDESAAAEFRALTETSLRSARGDRIGACRVELAGGRDVELADPEVGRRWIQVLNDLRLALGTRLGVTEDDDHVIDPDDPGHQDRLVYHWLTAVQDSIVQTLLT
ncbi:DUF2017 family protein [uncultured Jatrophihabitans sp.]|uniref:DUF2017 family protein n=1 Tax=uncultured Jatrophihabitans sp. TaxID=1610747 RepID=UPI0035CB2314